MNDSSKNLGTVLKAGSDYLAKNNVSLPQLACELLFSRLLNCNRLELPVKHDLLLNDKQLDAMRRGIKRVADGEPVQYVTGSTGFMGHDFKVDKRALIPRPETETLVEEILKYDPLWTRENKPLIVDIGTGSGCIVTSLALAKPDALYMGVDISKDAISLAEENALTLGVKDKIGFTCDDLSNFIEPETVDAIVTNLPYIPTAEYKELPVHIREHEPRTALDGGPDGLSVITSVIEDASIILKPGGAIFLEIGETQAQSLSALLQQAGFGNIKVIQDLTNRDRIVSATIN